VRMRSTAPTFATKRLQQLLSDPGARLERLACACMASEEGTRRLNYGRLCALFQSKIAMSRKF